MSKEMVISANPHETRVAIMEEGQLCEYYVERQKEFALVGSIYKGRVTRVLPGMQSAFVEIGLDSDAFLYVSDFLEETEELDQIVTTVVDKVEKMEEQGGRVFAAENPATPAVEPADVEPAPMESELATSEIPEAAPFGRGVRGESQATAAVQPPAQRSASSQERPRHDDRGRDQRNSGRGGRGGRGGRFNRHGGRRGGNDRQFGRDLPSAKYASPNSHEERPDSPAPGGEGHISELLPGESLAKYRDKPSSAAAPVTSEEPAASVAAPMETPEARPAIPEIRRETVAAETPAFEPRSEYRASASSSTGLEPLPGESLSKWKPRESAPEPAPESKAGSFIDEKFDLILHPQDVPSRETLHHYENSATEHAVEQETEEEDDRHEQESEEQELKANIVHQAAAVNEAHAAGELSDDEAAAIAEHVAEAQIEEEAREAHRREFVEGNESSEEANSALTPSMESMEEETLEEEVEESVAGALDEPGEMDETAESAGILEEVESLAEPIGTPETGSPRLEVMEGEHLSAEREQGGNEKAPPQPSRARVRSDFRARMQHPNPRRGRDRGRRDDRGRRPQHGQGGGQGGGQAQGHRHAPARRPQLIADMLKQGQEIIVQIAKEPLGKKGARITSHVALPGRYLVYMPTLDHTGVSRKIASAEERARLRHLVNEAKGSSGGGFIVRTAAASAAPEEVRTDVEFLTRTWSEIKARSEQRKAPAMLHRDLNLVERILRDYMTNDFSAVWVDSEEEFTKVVDFMSRFQPALVNLVKLYTKEQPIFEEFGIQQEIDKGLRPKVWLKSGGYIVINHTEALVAIDVNTGKFVGKGSNRLEDTIVRTNLEAVKEIVRQMRLRDLGGIIIIDFIDMEERRNREKVMAALEDALRADRAPSKMLRFNEFGLIAITRKRTKQALERTLCQPCPYCTGSGMVKSIPTLCYEIQTEARKMAPEISNGSVTLRVHPEISKALKTRESSLIEELEHWTKKSIIIQADPTLHWEQYDIY
jgi:Rne/Rng family ribonuclease